MCLASIGEVCSVTGDASAAVVSVDGHERVVSLVILTLEGTSVAPGDWLLLHTGMAVRVVERSEAEKLADFHRQVAGAEGER